MPTLGFEAFSLIRFRMSCSRSWKSVCRPRRMSSTASSMSMGNLAATAPSQKEHAFSVLYGPLKKRVRLFYFLFLTLNLLNMPAQPHNTKTPNPKNKNKKKNENENENKNKNKTKTRPTLSELQPYLMWEVIKLFLHFFSSRKEGFCSTRAILAHFKIISCYTKHRE